MNLKSKKGFTLVELIIVIAILGIIALIAVPNLTGVQKRSQINADIRTAEQIGKAVRIWLTDADINVQHTREDDIENYVTLSSLSAKGLDEYIPTTYKPQALTDSDYYVILKSNKVMVQIGSAATALTDVYQMTDNVAVAGVAYVEGASALTKSAIL